MDERNDDSAAPVQAAVIPYRVAHETVQFCLITSLKRKNWIFPKGFIDPGETCRETALKEAREEAGLHGTIVGDPLGSYASKKGSRTMEVVVLLMNATQCDDKWEEAALRKRRWVEGSKALKMLDSSDLRAMLEKAIERCHEGHAAER